MGTLEEAIREHLELMRRRGADPADVARAEAEALSPVTRDVAEPESHAEDSQLLAGTEPAPEPEPIEPEPAPEVEAPMGDPETGFIDQDTRHFDTLAGEDAELEVAGEQGDFDDSVLRSRDAEVEVPGAGADDGDLPADGPDQGPGAERSPDEEGDVLEGTPDFLAETPDHDKLWFEQSGPREFDFEDGD